MSRLNQYSWVWNEFYNMCDLLLNSEGHIAKFRHGDITNFWIKISNS